MAEELTQEQQAAAEAAAQNGGGEPQPFYAKYGRESEEDFDNYFNQLKSFETKEQELIQKEQEIASGLSILQEAENPFAEGIDTINAFAKKTGITDYGVISTVLNKNVEDLSKDPIQALFVAEAIGDPQAFKKMGSEKIMQSIVEEFGIEKDDDGNPIITARVEKAAIKALAKIEELQKSVTEVKNPYAIAKEQRQNYETQLSERKATVASEIDSILGAMTELKYENGERGISLQVSKEEVEALFNKEALSQFFDTSSKEWKEQLKTVISDQILLHKVKSGDFLKEWEKSHAAETERKITKEVLNGNAEPVNRAGTVKDSQMSPIMRAAIADGKAKV